MYSETDFTPGIQYIIYWQGKRVRTNEQFEDLSKHIVSIGNHEKGMRNAFFSPITMKWNVFCASKNHIPRGKKVKIFTVRYGGGVPPLSVNFFSLIFRKNSVRYWGVGYPPSGQISWLGFLKPSLRHLFTILDDAMIVYKLASPAYILLRYGALLGLNQNNTK